MTTLRGTGKCGSWGEDTRWRVGARRASISPRRSCCSERECFPWWEKRCATSGWFRHRCWWSAVKREMNAHLDVANTVGVAAVQGNAVAGNLVILLQIQDVAHSQVHGGDFNDHASSENPHDRIVGLLKVKGARLWHLVRVCPLDIIAQLSDGGDGEDEDQREPRRPRIVHRNHAKHLIGKGSSSCHHLENCDQKKVTVHRLTRHHSKNTTSTGIAHRDS